MLNYLASSAEILDLFEDHELSGEQLDQTVQAAAKLASQWQDWITTEQIPVINDLSSKVVVAKETITIHLDRDHLLKRLAGKNQKCTPIRNLGIKARLLTAQVKLRRSGIEAKLVYPTGNAPRTHDRSVKALQEAALKSLQWNEDLVSGAIRSIDALIERDNLNTRQVDRLRKLAFLAPDIMERIIASDVPETLTLERLKKDFPLDWTAQRAHFGLSQVIH